VRFTGDVAERAEEYQVAVGAGGKVTSVRHELPEAKASPSLGEDEVQLAVRELERLDAELRTLQDVPVLVCLHHPPVPVGSAWLDGVGLLNGDAFLDSISRHANVRCVLAGHVHQAFDTVRRGVRFLATPSTCAQFTPGTERCVMDRRPPGYRWIELHADGSFDTEVGWLDALVGEPRDESEWRR
jgi:Icc protein